MDDENNAKPYEQMDDLGGPKPLCLDLHPYQVSSSNTLPKTNSLQPENWC